MRDHRLDKAARFKNCTGQPLTLVVEPWATEETIPAGANFAILYPAPTGRDDTSSSEIYADQITFWCEGETFEVEVNGEIVPT